MGTRFFKIKVGSKIHKDLENVIEQNNKLNELMKIFTKENGIETTRYYISKTLMIDSTENDKEKFSKQLCKNRKQFRVNSAINKAYMAMLEDNKIDIHVVRGLSLWDYNAYIHGGASYKQWKDFKTGIFYLEITPKQDEPYNMTPDAEEIKGSEYYKAFETRND